MIKNESVVSFLLYLPFILFYDFLILTIPCFSGHTSKRIALNLRYLNFVLRKRRIIQNRRNK